MTFFKRLSFWQILIAATILVVLGAMFQMFQTVAFYKIDVFHSTWKYLMAGIAGLILFLVVLLLVSLTKRGAALLVIPDRVNGLSAGWKTLATLLFIALLPVYSLITLHPYIGQYFAKGSWTHLALFWIFSLGGMICLKVGRKELAWPLALGLTVIAQGVVSELAITFSLVNNYPFALGWSDTSRYYDASLFFSQRLYGKKIPLSVLHPAWHLLLTVPFIFGNLPIWLHRFWQSLLEAGLMLGFGQVFARRLKLTSRSFFYLVAGWAMLFVFQGPVIIHLLLCALVVFWGVVPGKPWRTSLVVLIASIWAGVCRINWFPVPGLLAALFYLLEIPLGMKRWSRYLVSPAIWFLGGTLVAFISNMAYMQLSGNGVGGNFSSSLTSVLLWYRLLPNPTYPLGILPGTLLVSAPIILVISLSLRGRWQQYHLVRLAGVFASLFILLVGGLVVSVKIGGGADLHNLDAYLVVLMTVGGYLFFDRFVPDRGDPRAKFQPATRNNYVIILAIAIPLWMLVAPGHSILTWDNQQADKTLQTIQVYSARVSGEGGEVLFMSQRQLLALKMVDAPLIPEYEQDFLMEMVMSKNSAYLDRFAADMASQRFGLIIAEQQNTTVYGRTRSFGEENDLWAKYVATPMLCYYEALPSSGLTSVVLYVPRQQPCK